MAWSVVFAFSSLSLWNRSSKARIEKRGQGVILPDRLLDRKRWALPVRLHHRQQVVVHHTNPFAELCWNPAVSKTVTKNRWSALSKALERSALLWCHLLTLLGSRTPSASWLRLIFPSQRSSALVQSNL